ncbi:MFS transporter [Kibdelosporangium persicum]|uniref:Major facilitator transporter n=1 Tax=Kibdelosporangium persicum TaxID=2698649 RepID=A0ABX2FE79_9PSEU|nr:MFS transporter [Kibdelosporangium persicum]NRN69528.1 Major facilitator transporter [Kibdelosporangium persicum]
MLFWRYSSVLRRPGLGAFVGTMFFARLPVTAAGVTLTLHVVLTLDLGYGSAGLLGAVFTIGSAVGSPWLGRLTDRKGLRFTVLLTATAQGIFWLLAPLLSYQLLLGTALFAGLLTLPVFAISRQALPALVPAAERRTAYSLDSIGVELSFMAGPALAVLAATRVSTSATMAGIGVAMLLSGLVLWWLDPPIRGAHEEPASAGERRPSRREWLTRPLLFVIIVNAGLTIVLSGNSVAIVATLENNNQVGFTGLVLIVWGVASLIGAVVHGAIPRSLRLATLMVLLCVLIMPAGLATSWWLLALLLIPAGSLCAPTVATTGESVSTLVPAAVRGEAMGLQGAAATAGNALGAPIAGAIIDVSGVEWGFAAIGATGLLMVAIGLSVRGARTGVARQPVG